MESLELVEGYINAKENFPIKSKLVKTKKLSGGLVNFVYRLVFENKETAILKNFPAFFSSNKDIAFSQNRYFIEKAALELLGNNEELKNSIRVPKLLYSDDDAFVLVMEDAGEHTKSLFQILQANNDLENVNKEELINKLAKNIRIFSRFLTEKSGVSPKTHENLFANNYTKDLSKAHFMPLLKSVSKEFELEKELQHHIDASEKLSELPIDDKAVFVNGDLWPGSFLIDLKKEIFWVTDWEISRFGSPTSDLEMLISNLWIMKQNTELFNTDLIEKTIKRLKFEFFGDENIDFRRQCGNAKTSFILLTLSLILIRQPDWEIKDTKSCIVKALSEFN